MAASGKPMPELDPESAAIMTHYLQDFAGNLETARAVYRACPDLVTAKRFPKEWVRFFEKEYGFAPSDDAVVQVPNLELFRRLEAESIPTVPLRKVY